MKEIQCPFCKEMIPDDSRFCDMCGAPLPRRLVLKARKGDLIIVPEHEAVIGRIDSPYANILAPLSLISRRHGQFLKRGSRWYIIDFGSTNGTLVNDVELTPDEPARFDKGDVIDIGTYIFDVVEQ